MKTLALMGLLLAMAAGCATKPRPAPLTLAEVISMSKAGLWDEEIIRHIEASGSVFRLGADDVVRLRNEGVSDRVINYMLETYTRAAVAEQHRRDFYFYGGYYHCPWHRPWWW